MRKRLLVWVLALAVFGAVPAAAGPVGLDLTLLVDVSGSIDTGEFNLQRQGYVNAFQSAGVQNAIASAVGDGIAARLIYWSGSAQQAVAVNWMQLTDAASANAFAAAVLAAPRGYSGLTAPGSAINYAVANSFSSGFGDAATRRVFDVSGDGAQNDGANTAAARDAAAALGVRINGLTIGGGASLQSWYLNNVVTTGGFLIAANDFADFGSAIQRKIEREILEPIPEPGSMLLLGTGLIGAAGAIRRKLRRR